MFIVQTLSPLQVIMYSQESFFLKTKETIFQRYLHAKNATTKNQYWNTISQLSCLSVVCVLRQSAYSDDFAMQFRRKSPPDSDASRHGDPMDFATPGRSVATLDISFFS